MKHKRNKWYTIQLLTTVDQCWPSLFVAINISWPTSSVCMLSLMPYSMENPSGQFRPAVPAILPPSLLCPCLLSRAYAEHVSIPEHRNLKIPWLRVGAAEQQLKHRCVINVLHRFNLKQSTVPATRKEINSIPYKHRTGNWFHVSQGMKRERNRAWMHTFSIAVI